MRLLGLLRLLRLRCRLLGLRHGLLRLLVLLRLRVGLRLRVLLGLRLVSSLLAVLLRVAELDIVNEYFYLAALLAVLLPG